MDLESLLLGVSFNEVRIIEKCYYVHFGFFSIFFLSLEPNSVLFSFNTSIPQYEREKGDLEYQKVALIE